ncbi:DUF433 domain-containing protein [Neolewinella sp.]|uniref:DUF433 domain-containing protein n=1 Tax=Neolewinella sp. TaxID=2993543 RepID=UPI003B52EE5C
MTAFIDRTLQEARQLPESERWQLVRALLSDISPRPRVVSEESIQQTPGVAGGRPCVANTRIPVSHVVYYLNAGESDAEILAVFPSLRMMDLSAVKAYYAANKAAVDSELREEEE